MELVVAKVERSVDGFERLKVNVNLRSIDFLNIRLLTRGCQQLFLPIFGSKMEKDLQPRRASISSNFQCKKTQLSMFFNLRI